MLQTPRSLAKSLGLETYQAMRCPRCYTLDRLVKDRSCVGCVGQGAARAIKNAAAREHRHSPEARAVKQAASASRGLMGRGKTTVLDRLYMYSVYRKRDALIKSTGVKHHVDHVIPIKHPKVCGLHVPANLKVITADANRSKGNRFVTDWE